MTIAMCTRRLIAATALFAWVLLWAGDTTRADASQPPTASATEYVNLPISHAQLRLNIRKANLIARGKIIAYEPPKVRDHAGTLEKTTILVEETYAGTEVAGTTLTYVCVCHQVEQPAAADLIGHEVLVFLAYDGRMQTWSLATGAGELFFHPDLGDRVKRMLRKAK